MQDTRRLTESQARLLLREWQDDLGLCHWNVRLDVRRFPELKTPAVVNITESKQCARIRLLDPEDRATHNGMEPDDMERDLVHEEVHIALAPFTGYRKGSHKQIVQEQAVHAFSKCLVAMKREIRELRAEVERLERRAQRKPARSEKRCL